MIKRLSSRKLAAVAMAISGIVGLVLGLAVIQPELLLDEISAGVIALAVIAISGLGGYIVKRQAGIDEQRRSTSELVIPPEIMPFTQVLTDDEEDLLARTPLGEDDLSPRGPA